MIFLYLAIILVTIVCLLLVDYRYKLVFFKNLKAAAISIIVVWACLFFWDILGISRGIFYSGGSNFMSGIYFFKDMPLEEPFLLIVIAYTPLLIWNYLRSKDV